MKSSLRGNFLEECYPPLYQIIPLNSTTTTINYKSPNSNLNEDNSDFFNYYQEIKIKNDSNRKKIYIFVEFHDIEHENTYSSAIMELVLYNGSQTHQELYDKKYPEFLNSYNVQDYYYNNLSDKDKIISQSSTPLLNMNNTKNILLSSPPHETTAEVLSQNTIMQSPIIPDININPSLSNPEHLPCIESEVHKDNNIPGYILNGFSVITNTNANTITSNNTIMLNFDKCKNNTPVVMHQVSTAVNNSGMQISILPSQFLPSPTLDTPSFDTHINKNTSLLVTSLPSPQNNTFSDQVYKFNPMIGGGNSLMNSNSIVNTFPKQFSTDLSSIKFYEFVIHLTMNCSTSNTIIPSTINLYNNYNCQYQSNINISYVQSLKTETPKRKKAREVILDEQSSKNFLLEINCINEIDKYREYFSSNGLLISYYSIMKKSMGKIKDSEVNNEDSNSSSNESKTYNSENRIKRVFETGSKANFIHSSPYIIGDSTTLLYNSKLGRNNTYYFFVISNDDKILFISELVTIKTYRRSKNEKNKTTKEK
ncbi:hypothetical protein BCR36DRAFT_455126 [Piromyces finnis]|uniref:Uncharacterized protein n=1 Tax=Piromyces finnis TaxID=1754191 RepID=A0A1Y1V4H6_9FUNG|nr:hypothetical protein BCR36DRAFT_455126 [Piromyces finnis]|eukprot:ORX47130.1 hypothetical protein BCR36DRAFT_455126 [Piromyces finnis]